MAFDLLSGLFGGIGAGIGGYFQANAAKEASDQQAQAAANALGFQRKVYGDVSAQLKPFVEGGTRAFNQLLSPYGIGPKGVIGAPSGEPGFNYFYNSPDYQFAFDQGNRAQQMNHAAQGNYLSGSQLRGGQEFGQGLATQQYGNYFNRLMGLATMGQNSAANQATFGQNMANTMGNTQLAQGAYQGAGTIGQANAYAGIFPNALAAYQMMNYPQAQRNSGNNSGY